MNVLEIALREVEESAAEDDTVMVTSEGNYIVL